MLKKALSFLGVGFLTLSFAFAMPVKFEVEVSPNPLKQSEFADVTIKAIDENGSIDTSYTDGDIWIEVEGFEYTDPDVVIPGGGIGFFEASDMGVKIFSKGLTIKAAGTYDVTVVDVYEPSIKGSTKVQVLSDGTGIVTGEITVSSPSDGSIETTDVVNVVGSTTFPNTAIVLFIDDVEVQEGLTDAQGAFSVIVTGIRPGKHSLSVNALDLEDQVIATSGPVEFTYQKDEGPLFVGLEIQPGKEIMVNQKAIYTIKTAERVASAMLKIGDGTFVPTNKKEEGVFEKEVLMEDVGTFLLDVSLQADGKANEFNDVESIAVKDEVRRIITLTHTDDPSKDRSDLAWTYEGTIEYFKVRYGTNQNNLRLSLTTSKAEGTLILADPTKVYYAQVFPVDVNGIITGEPSEIIKIGPLKEPQPLCGNGIVEAGEECDDGNIIANDGCGNQCVIELPKSVCGNGAVESGEQCDDGNKISEDGCSSTCQLDTTPIDPAPTLPENGSANDKKSCYPDGIILETEMVNGKYYITWEPVDLAREYVVYRADQAVGSLSQMRIVGTTQNTRFEYPFNPDSEIDRYAWYAVEALCDETEEKKQVGDITAVKVGPENTIIALIFLVLFGFGLIRLLRPTQ